MPAGIRKASWAARRIVNVKKTGGTYSDHWAVQGYIFNIIIITGLTYRIDRQTR
jgi:hypothetical protein